MRKRNFSMFVMFLMINMAFSQSNPGLGDVSNSFYDTFDGSTVDLSKWTIMNQVWSTNNGGVVPANISMANGYLRVEAHGDYYTGTVTGHGRNTRVGGAIKTNAKMGPGTYEVRAKICPQLGALTAFWTYEYGTNGQAGYSEIDFETPGDISLNKIICTNYSTETQYSSKVVPVTQNDGNFHTYKFEWYPASVTNSPYVKYYFDGNLIVTSTTNVPNYNAQFNIGVWFPNGWAGTPNFDTDYMYVDWVKITPAGSTNTGVTCNITSPSNGATFTSGSNVTVNVTASTSNGTITNVEFYQNGVYLGADNSSPFSYTISAIAAGTHALEAVAYSSSGAHAVSGTVNITVNSTNSNIALNKTATASSIETAGFEAAKAFDGNQSSRWSSQYTDAQWIYVDLGATYNVNRVKIIWEAAYAKNYTIQVSANKSTWTTIKTVTNNSTLINDHTGLSRNGRYVRLNCTKRAIEYGYSVFEIEVYGTLVSSSEEIETLIDAKNENNFTVFPCPATNELNIKSQNCILPTNIEIYSINGNLIYQCKAAGTLTTINTTELNTKGMVFVKVISENEASIFKTIIK